MQSLYRLIGIFALALVIGLGTAWYMVDTGSALSTRRIGVWSVWHGAGAPKADPYTRAHLARSSELPITSERALYYLATQDGAGDPLVSGCEYIIGGPPMNAAWWSIAVYDSAGRLIANKADRHAFSSREMVRRVDGSYRVVLARNARPGNWLPTGDAKRLQIVLRLFAPRGAAGSIDSSVVERQLPEIAKRDCEGGA